MGQQKAVKDDEGGDNDTADEYNWMKTILSVNV